MRRISFIKFCPSIQLAHLYEHVFSGDLVKALSLLGYYDFIDFTVEANTYHDGFVLLEVLCRQDIEHQVAATVKELRVAPDGQSVAISINQISAEKRLQIGYDQSGLPSALETLGNEPWHELQDAPLHNALTSLEDNKTVWLTDKPAAVKRLDVAIALPAAFVSDNPGLLPLAYILSNAIMYTVRHDLCSTHGCYSNSVDVTTSSELGYQLNNSFSAVGEPIGTQEVQDTISAVMSRFNHGVLNYLVEKLKNADYRAENPWYDPVSTFNRTGILLGDSVWAERVSTDDARDALQAMRTTVKLDKQDEA